MTNSMHAWCGTTARRMFLTRAALAGSVPAASSLTGGMLSGTPDSTTGTELPDFVPVPSKALGPAINGGGDHIGRIDDNLCGALADGTR